MTDEFNWLHIHGRPLSSVTKGQMKSLFKNYLTGLFDRIIEYGDMPFWYTENPFSTFLAQAATCAGGYAIHDYVDRPDEEKRNKYKKRKNQKNRTYRPDLYICLTKIDMVVEVKKGGVSLGITSPLDKIFPTLNRTLTDAYDKLKKDKKKKDPPDYGCSLGVVFVNYNKSRWTHITESDSYDEEARDLRESVKKTIENKKDWDECYECAPNFYYLYLLDKDHQETLGKYKYKHLGCIVIGKLARWE